MNAVRVKFCGLVRPADVEYAGELGADLVGAVLAGGPRQRSVEQVHALFGACTTVVRVAVLGAAWHAQARALLADSSVDVLQLHAHPDEAEMAAARAAGAAEVWAAVPVDRSGLPGDAPALCRAADAVVLDTRQGAGFGGTGVAFDWELVAEQLEPIRGGSTIVLAGGLTPQNVTEAIRVLRPDVVDVSSGVEAAPGVKDWARMRAFVDAVRDAT